MSNTAKLLVIETVIMPKGDSAFATLSDLYMMVVTGGRERTEAEYTGLFAKSGLPPDKRHSDAVTCACT